MILGCEKDEIKQNRIYFHSVSLKKRKKKLCAWDIQCRTDFSTFLIEKNILCFRCFFCWSFNLLLNKSLKIIFILKGYAYNIKSRGFFVKQF